MTRQEPSAGARLARTAAAAVAVVGGVAAPPPKPTRGLRPEWSAVLERFPVGEYRDIECDRVRGGFVLWQEVREQARLLDRRWRDKELPTSVCEELGVRDRSSEFGLIQLRPERAASECALGSVTALLLSLICSSACLAAGDGELSKQVVASFELLWRDTLAGAAALPVYMLGTSSWPIASFLAKWQAHCRAAGAVSARPGLVTPPAICNAPEVETFATIVEGMSERTLLPVLWRSSEVAMNVEVAIGEFARVMIPSLANFMNSAAAATPGFAEVVRDPLDPPRLSELGAQLASLSAEELLVRTPFSVGATLAASRWLTWRSHRLYGGGADVPLGEVRWVLELVTATLRDADGLPPEDHHALHQ